MLRQEHLLGLEATEVYWQACNMLSMQLTGLALRSGPPHCHNHRGGFVVREFLVSRGAGVLVMGSGSSGAKSRR
jgi:hypothetical protein